MKRILLFAVIAAVYTVALGAVLDTRSARAVRDTEQRYSRSQMEEVMHEYERKLMAEFAHAPTAEELAQAEAARRRGVAAREMRKQTESDQCRSARATDERRPSEP